MKMKNTKYCGFMKSRLPQLITFLIENNVQAECVADIFAKNRVIVSYSNKKVKIESTSSYPRRFLEEEGVDDLNTSEFMALLYKEVGFE